MRKLSYSESKCVSGSGFLEVLPFGHHSTAAAMDMAQADLRSGLIILGSLGGAAALMMSGMGMASACMGLLALPMVLEILL